MRLLRQADEAPMRFHVGQSVGTNPDTAADARRLANRYGMPTEVVERNHEAYKQRAAMDDAAAFTKQQPTLAGWLGEHPNNAALAQDDLPVLSTIGTWLRAAENTIPTLIGGAATIGDQFWSAVYQYAEIAKQSLPAELMATAGQPDVYIPPSTLDQLAAADKTPRPQPGIPQNPRAPGQVAPGNIDLYAQRQVTGQPPPAQAAERTPLSPAEEQQFQQWVKDNKITDLDHPDSAYDYRGFWKALDLLPQTGRTPHR